jgi:hypothetical protein
MSQSQKVNGILSLDLEGILLTFKYVNLFPTKFSIVSFIFYSMREINERLKDQSQSIIFCACKIDISFEPRIGLILNLKLSDFFFRFHFMGSIEVFIALEALI